MIYLCASTVCKQQLASLHCNYVLADLRWNYSRSCLCNPKYSKSCLLNKHVNELCTYIAIVFRVKMTWNLLNVLNQGIFFDSAQCFSSFSAYSTYSFSILTIYQTQVSTGLKLQSAAGIMGDDGGNMVSKWINICWDLPSAQETPERTSLAKIFLHLWGHAKGIAKPLKLSTGWHQLYPELFKSVYKAMSSRRILGEKDELNMFSFMVLLYC